MKRSTVFFTAFTLAFSLLVMGGTGETFPVTKKKVAGFTLLYYEFTGSYQKAFGPFDELLAFVKESKIETGEYYVGIYLDNPQMTPAEKLRSEIGVMVNGKVADTGKYKMKKVEGFTAVSTWYHSMDEIAGAWNALGKHLMTRGLIPAGPGYEFYRTDKEPSDMSAECFFPISETKE